MARCEGEGQHPADRGRIGEVCGVKTVVYRTVRGWRGSNYSSWEERQEDECESQIVADDGDRKYFRDLQARRVSKKKQKKVVARRVDSAEGRTKRYNDAMKKNAEKMGRRSGGDSKGRGKGKGRRRGRRG